MLCALSPHKGQSGQKHLCRHTHSTYTILCIHGIDSWTSHFALYAGVALAASFAPAASVWLCLHSGPNRHQCLPDHRAAQRPGEGHTGKQEWQVPTL